MVNILRLFLTTASLEKCFRLKEDGFDSSEYCLIGYNEALCYQNLRKSEEAYSILSEIIGYVDDLKTDESKGKIYHIYATVCIKLKKDYVDEYKKKAFNIKNIILFLWQHPMEIMESIILK